MSDNPFALTLDLEEKPESPDVGGAGNPFAITKPAAPTNPFAITKKPPSEHSALVRSAVTGLTKDLPEQVGNTMRVFGMDTAGKAVHGAGFEPEGFERPQIGLKTLLEPGGFTGSNLSTFAQSLLGQSLSSMLPTLGGAGAGTAIGAGIGAMTGPAAPAAIPAFAAIGNRVGAFTASYVQNTGDLFGALEEAGVPEGKAKLFAAMAGAPIAALDSISFGAMQNTVIKSLKDKVKEGLVKGLLKTSLTEGGTEAAQQTIQETVVQALRDAPVDVKDAIISITESGLGGIIGGGAVHGAGKALGATKRLVLGNEPDEEKALTDDEKLFQKVFKAPTPGDEYLIDGDRSMTVERIVNDPKSGRTYVVGSRGEVLDAMDFAKNAQLLRMLEPQTEAGANENESQIPPVIKPGLSERNTDDQLAQAMDNAAEAEGQAEHAPQGVAADEQAARIDNTPRQSELLAPPPPFMAISINDIANADQANPERYERASALGEHIGQQIDAIEAEIAKVKAGNKLSDAGYLQELTNNLSAWTGKWRELQRSTYKAPTPAEVQKAEELSAQSVKQAEDVNAIGNLGRAASDENTGEVPPAPKRAELLPQAPITVGDLAGNQALSPHEAEWLSPEAIAAGNKLAEERKNAVPPTQQGSLKELPEGQRFEGTTVSQADRAERAKLEMQKAAQKEAEEAQKKRTEENAARRNQRIKENLSALSKASPTETLTDWLTRLYTNGQRVLSTNPEKALAQARRAGFTITDNHAANFEALVNKVQNDIIREQSKSASAPAHLESKTVYDKDEKGRILRDERGKPTGSRPVVQYAKKPSASTRPVTLSGFVAQRGGISLASLFKLVGNTDMSQSRERHGIGRVFTSKGLDIRDMANLAREAGYPIKEADQAKDGKEADTEHGDEQSLYELLRADMDKTKDAVVTEEERDRYERMKEEEQVSDESAQDDQIHRVAEQLGIKPWDKSDRILKSEEAWRIYVRNAQIAAENEKARREAESTPQQRALRAELEILAKQIGVEFNEGTPNDVLDEMVADKLEAERITREGADEIVANQEANQGNEQIADVIDDQNNDVIPFQKTQTSQKIENGEKPIEVVEIPNTNGVYYENYERTAKLRANLTAELQAILRRIGVNAKIVVVDRAFDPAETGDAQVGGLIAPDGSIIVTLRMLDSFSPNRSEMQGTVRHEAIHVLRTAGVLSDADWKLLSNQFDRWRKLYNVDKLWAASGQQAYDEAVEHYSKYPQLSIEQVHSLAEAAREDRLNEEAVAEYAARGYVNTNSAINKIMEKVRQFFSAIQNLIKNGQLKSAQGIIADIMEGKRAEQIAAGKREGVRFSKYKSEQTDQGEQLVIPGAERISDKQLAERKMKEMKKTDKLQRGTAGTPLFDLLSDWRDSKQHTLFQKLPSTAPILDPTTLTGMSALKAFSAFPRSLARRDTIFGALYNAMQRKMDTAMAKIAEYSRTAEPYSKASYETRRKAEAILELMDALALPVQPRGGKIVVHNTGRVNVLGSKPGETLVATGNVLQAVMALDAMNKSMWQDAIYGLTQRVGFTTGLQGAIPYAPGKVPTSKEIFDAAAAESKASKKEALTRLAEVVKHMEEQEKVAYMHKFRHGDSYIWVKAIEGSDEAKAASPNENSPTVWFNLVDTLGTDTLVGQAKDQVVRRSPAERKKVLAAKVKELEKQFPPDKYRIGSGIVTRENLMGMAELNVMEKLALNSQLEIADDLDEKQSANANAVKSAILSGEYKDSFLDSLYDSVKASHKRKSRNIPGYSGDFELAIAQRIRSGANNYALMVNHGLIKDAQAGMFGEPDKKRPGYMVNGHPDRDMRNYARNWLQYVEGTTNDFSKLRKFAFMSFMWMSLGAPLINLTQNHFVTGFQMGLWMHKNAEAGVAHANASFTAWYPKLLRAARAGWDGAFIDIDSIPGMSPEMRRSAKDLQDKGLLGTIAYEDITGTANLSGLYNNPKTRTIAKGLDHGFNIGSSVYAFSEQAVRIIAHNTAFKAAQNFEARWRFNEQYKNNQNWVMFRTANGVKTVYDITPEMIARFVVDETQFVQGKLNNPEYARSWGALVAQFKKYQLNYASFIGDLFKNHGAAGKRMGTYALLSLGTMSGALGLPLAEDILVSLVRTIASIFGSDHDPDKWFRDLMHEKGVDDLYTEILMRGVGRLGPVDVSKRFGQGDFIPSTDPAALFGPFVSATVGRAMSAKTRLENNQPIGAAAELMPKGLSDLTKANLAWPNEGYATKKGTIMIPPSQITAAERIARSMGFQPSDMAFASQYTNDIRLASAEMNAMTHKYTSRYRNIEALTQDAADAGDLQRMKELDAKMDQLYVDLDKELAESGVSIMGKQFLASALAADQERQVTKLDKRLSKNNQEAKVPRKWDRENYRYQDR